MKSFRINLMASVVVCFLVFLMSCSVREATPLTLAENGVNLELVQEVGAIADREVQKIAFLKMLSSEEKVFMFKKRIIEKKETLGLNAAQKNHLDLLMSHMPGDMYSNTTKAQTDFVAQWGAQGEKIFDKAVLYDIVSSLSSKKSGSVQKRGPTGIPLCECNTAQDFCPEGFRCRLITSCGPGGCGWLFVSRCNGTCDFIPGM